MCGQRTPRAGRKESYRIPYPAYGTYLGGNAANLLNAPIALPVYAGALAAGHVAGRMKAGEVDTTPATPSWESEALESDDEAIPAVALERLPAIE